MTINKRKRAARRGATLVEFALVLPLIMLFFTASIEFFRLNQIRHVADNAAYEACRHVMVPGANQQEAIDRAQAMLRIVGIRNAQVTINPSTIAESTTEVTVTVGVPTQGNTWIFPQFAGNRVIGSSSTLVTERIAAIQAGVLGN